MLRERNGKRSSAKYQDCIFCHAIVRNAMVHLVLLYSLLAALYVLALQLAGLIRSLGPSGFGTLLAMSGLGMALGAVMMAQLGHHFSRRRLTAAGLSLITFSLVLLSQFKGSLNSTLALCGILGVGAALVAIPAHPWTRRCAFEHKQIFTAPVLSRVRHFFARGRKRGCHLRERTRQHP